MACFMGVCRDCDYIDRSNDEQRCINRTASPFAGQIVPDNCSCDEFWPFTDFADMLGGDPNED